jgi:hypothetical protein
VERLVQNVAVKSDSSFIVNGALTLADITKGGSATSRPSERPEEAGRIRLFRPRPLRWWTDLPLCSRDFACC